MTTSGFAPHSDPALQGITEQMFLVHGLPFEGETCQGLLAPIMPQVVARLPKLVFDEGEWDPDSYRPFTPFEAFQSGTSPDKEMDLWFRATYRRKPEATPGPEFVRVTCYCAIQVGIYHLHSELNFDMRYLVQRLVRREVHSQSFDHVLVFPEVASTVQSAKFCLQPWNKVIEARAARVQTHNSRKLKESERRVRAFSEMSIGLFQYYTGVKRIGAELMSLFTHRLANDADWVRFTVRREAENVLNPVYLAEIYRMYDNGAHLIEVCETKIAIAPLSDAELVERFLRTRR